MSRRKMILRGCGLVIGFLIFVAIARVGIGNARSLVLPPPLYFSLGILVLVLHFILAIEGWRLLLIYFGLSVSVGKAYHAWILSSFGGYVPGKIWPYVTKWALVSGARSSVAASIGTETALGVAACLFWVPFAGDLPDLIALITGFTLLGAAIALFIFGLRLAGQWGKIDFMPGSVAHLLRCMPVFLLSWVAYGMGHWIILYPTIGANFNPIDLTGHLAASWLLGAISVIFPAGIGISDVTLVITLSPQQGFGGASSVALLVRMSNLLSHAALGLFYVIAVFARRLRSDP